MTINIKRIIIILLIGIIIFMPFFTCFSYADENTGTGGGGAWDPITTEDELVAAFKAYCQYKNFDTYKVPNTVEAIVKWDYTQLERFAALADVDLEGLNAHIWYATETNKPLKFYLDAVGITEFNKIYSSLVTENNIQPNTTKRVYNGKYFEDLDGNECFCYILNDGTTNSYYTSITPSVFNANVILGTYYRFLGRAYYLTHDEGNEQYQIRYRNQTYNYNIRVNKDHEGSSGNISDFCKLTLSPDAGTNFSHDASFYADTAKYFDFEAGNLAIIFNPNSNKYYLGVYMKCKRLNGGVLQDYVNCRGYIELSDMLPDSSTVDYSQGDEVETPENKSVQITTDDDTINNYITNNNSTVTHNYYDDDDPPDYTNPYNDNPTGTTIDPDGKINFQMPELNINWRLDINVDDLPFPFSIPKDIYNAFKMLDVEAEAPHFEGTVDLYVCTWDIDFDLEDYSSTANVVKKWFIFVYVVGLIIATRSLMHVY